MALSTCEAEYIAAIHVLQHDLSLRRLMDSTDSTPTTEPFLSTWKKQVKLGLHTITDAKRMYGST